VFVQLRPGLIRVRRGTGAQQIGLGEHGTVVDGLTDADLALLDRLDNGVDTRTLCTGDDTARTRTRELVDLLTENRLLAHRPRRRPQRPATAAGLASEAAVWALVHRSCQDGWDILTARASRNVLVVGTGRTADAVAHCLSGTGIAAHAEAEPENAPAGPRSGTGTDRRWDLVVLVDHAVADSLAADRFLTADVPHLSVVVRETDVLVGPLVRPGQGPCLRCLDLHRSARDPQWPLVLAQLVRPARRPDPPEAGALAALTAGIASLQVVTFLDGFGTPTSVGATLEVELPDGMICRRPWPAHPSCGCHWPPTGVPALGPPQWPGE
jgi:bacteriocin biosynthesis cyclodehydratase domain-containing protein